MTPVSRRAFVTASIAACAGLALSRRSAAGQPQPAKEDSFFEWKAIGDGAFVAMGYGGNALVLKGPDGGILVDCKNAPYGKALRREGVARAGELKGVINTHHHADHTGGNHAFTADIPTFAHEKATPRILGQMNRYISQAKEAASQWGEKKGPAQDRVHEDALEYYKNIENAKPTDYAPRTGVPDTRTLELAGLKLELRHFGPGHTDNDMVVFVPALNVLHTGDLLFAGMHPYVDQSAGGNTTGWSASARKAFELCDAKTIVVPGHGAITTPAALKEQAEYFEKVREVVARAVKAGKTRKEVAEMDTGLYANYEAANRRGMTLGAIFDELNADAKPQAK